MKLHAATFLGILLIAPAIESAQIRRPVTAGRVDETTRVIDDCEKRTNTFKRSVRRKSHGDLPNLQRDVDQLEEALNRVGESWNRDHSPQKTRSYVGAAITISQSINRYMSVYRGDADLLNQWLSVRAEINRLAQTFGLPVIRW
jgi:hypothetical protein